MVLGSTKEFWSNPEKIFMMMMIAPNSRARKGGGEKWREAKGEYEEL